MTQDSELPSLSLEQIDVLKRFALFEATTDDLRDALEGVFEFNFVGSVRTAKIGFRVPEPGVIITRNHIHHAVEQKQLGKISAEKLIFWATMLLLNDAFELDPNDQEFVAEWINGSSAESVGNAGHRS